MNFRIGSQENWLPGQEEDLTGWGVRIEINRGAVDIFGKKWISLFPRNGKFPLVERRRKCHHLDCGWSWLHAGTPCDLFQLSSLICAVIRNGAVCFKIESCSEKFQCFFAQRWTSRRQFSIPSVVFSTKEDMLLLIGEAKYKFVLGGERSTLDVKFQNKL